MTAATRSSEVWTSRHVVAADDRVAGPEQLQARRRGQVRGLAAALEPGDRLVRRRRHERRRQRDRQQLHRAVAADQARRDLGPGVGAEHPQDHRRPDRAPHLLGQAPGEGAVGRGQALGPVQREHRQAVVRLVGPRPGQRLDGADALRLAVEQLLLPLGRQAGQVGRQDPDRRRQDEPRRHDPAGPPAHHRAQDIQDHRHRRALLKASRSGRGGGDDPGGSKRPSMLREGGTSRTPAVRIPPDRGAG